MLPTEAWRVGDSDHTPRGRPSPCPEGRVQLGASGRDGRTGRHAALRQLRLQKGQGGLDSPNISTNDGAMWTALVSGDLASDQGVLVKGSEKL